MRFLHNEFTQVYWKELSYHHPARYLFLYMQMFFSKSMLWFWLLQHKHFVNMLLKNQTFCKYFLNIFVYNIWHGDKSNVNISNYLRNKVESSLFDIRNIRNRKSRRRQIPLTKIRLCGFWYQFSEIGYCVSEIGESESEQIIWTKTWVCIVRYPNYRK